MRRALRAFAVAIAAAGAIDPVFAVRRPQPLRLEILGGPQDAASRVRDRLRRTFGTDVAFDTGEVPDASIIAAPVWNQATLRAGVPVSVVMPAPPFARNIRLLAAHAPSSILVGQQAIYTAQFEGIGVEGDTSIIELQRDGVVLASATHRWASNRERFTAALNVVPPAPGLSRVTVLARGVTGEASDRDNAADLALLALARTLRVAIYEPRPSWAVGFVRRAVESDPIFSSSTLLRPSPGRVVTAGPPLRALSAQSLATFDAVIVGAPEELDAAEVKVLASFCEKRGGAVVFAPDRRPSGPYAALISPTGFDEVLLEQPAVIGSDASTAIRASEFAIAKRLGRGATAVASLPGSPPRAAIVSLPRGRGRVVFSGALDAWRYRSSVEADRAFSRFWTGLLANLGASSPRRLSITVDPAVAAPGERLTVHASIDPEAFPSRQGGEGPLVAASLVARDGTKHFVRLWPAAEEGRFDGEVMAPAAGLYDARLSVDGKTADTALLIADDVQHPPGYDDEALQLIARTTGGVAGDLSDTTGLERHLRMLPRHDEPHPVRPMRAGWWSLPFAAALCAEWAIRRRRGAR
jgi:hypothetical protein